MKLVIGGCSQGKLEYVLKDEVRERYCIFDGILPDAGSLQEIIAQEKTVIINHFHKWVKISLLQGRKPEEEVQLFLENTSQCIIICDEIGNGIVPIDAFEREYRERTGRMLITLAGQAYEVVRVICGIGQKIK